MLLTSCSPTYGVPTTDLRPVFLIPTFSNSPGIVRFANMLLNESPDITDRPLKDCALSGCEPQLQFLLSNSESFGVIYVPMIHRDSLTSARIIDNLILKLSKLPGESQELVALINVISSRNYLEDLSAFKSLLGLSDLTTLEIRDDTPLASQLYDILQLVQYPHLSDTPNHLQRLVMTLAVLGMTGLYFYLWSKIRDLTSEQSNLVEQNRNLQDELNKSHNQQQEELMKQQEEHNQLIETQRLEFQQRIGQLRAEFEAKNNALESKNTTLESNYGGLVTEYQKLVQDLNEQKIGKNESFPDSAATSVSKEQSQVSKKPSSRILLSKKVSPE